MDKIHLKQFTIFLILISMFGCASHLIEVRPGSENINLLNSTNAQSCKFLGKVTVGVLSEIGFYSRSTDVVEANLLQLARNSAIDSGADSVVKEDMPEYGRRNFSLYKCAR
jgi:hypothetical protein